MPFPAARVKTTRPLKPLSGNGGNGRRQVHTLSQEAPAPALAQERGMTVMGNGHATGGPHGGVIPSWKWGVVWLLFLATLINYMDRQTMQATSSHLIREFFDGKERGYGQVES